MRSAGFSHRTFADTRCGRPGCRSGRSRDEPSSWPAPSSLSRALGVDVLLCPLTNPSLAEPGVPTVVTVHDLQPVDLPSSFTPEVRAFWMDALDRTAALADRIVCDSRFTQRRAIDVLELRAEQTTVIPPFLHGPLPLGDAELGRRLFRRGLVARGYFLYPANCWPRKNDARLLDVYGRYALTTAATGRSPMPLVCTGVLEDRAERLWADVCARCLDGLVQVLGPVADEDLCALLQHGRALIHPSLYEGFGRRCSKQWPSEPRSCARTGPASPRSLAVRRCSLTRKTSGS